MSEEVIARLRDIEANPSVSDANRQRARRLANALENMLPIDKRMSAGRFVISGNSSTANEAEVRYNGSTVHRSVRQRHDPGP